MQGWGLGGSSPPVRRSGVGHRLERSAAGEMSLPVFKMHGVAGIDAGLGTFRTTGSSPFPQNFAEAGNEHEGTRDPL